MHCSVIKNWGQEIKKWLGMERAAYLVLLPGKEAASQVHYCVMHTGGSADSANGWLQRPTHHIYAGDSIQDGCEVAHPHRVI